MKVVIYGKPNCPYCVSAKELVKTKAGIEYEYIDIVEAGLGKEELSMLVGKPVLTVPQIFVDDKPIGGFSDLEPIIKRYEPFDPDMNYYVRERGEGDWRLASYEYYLESYSRYEMDTKKELKSDLIEGLNL